MASPVITRPIGGHVSCAGGPLKALERAEALGFNTLQIHPSAPQSWAKPSVTDEVAAEYKEKTVKSGLHSSFFHNIYLTNFASENPAIWHGCIESSKSYMSLAAKMGVQGVVTHLGSHKGAGMEEVMPRLVEGLKRLLDGCSTESTFLIENTAGAGGTIGRSLIEIEMILEQVLPHHKNVGICIDTCHAFASGINIHTAEGVEAFLNEFKTRFGLEKLACIHLNDSKNAFGTNKDRHENIGQGHIGDSGFLSILNHPDLATVPLIMEVPGYEEKGPDKLNLEHVRSLLNPA
ncbi:MAG: deoxyribonuclease [Patescibacteria group bacterium]|jgi:deoxyribonuclease-4|nr:deoxyribonuclease [Patescibacteria group bacterium]